MAVDTRPTKGDGASPVPLIPDSPPLLAGAASLRPRAAYIARMAILSVVLLLGGVALGALLSADWTAQPASDLNTTAPLTRQSGREMVAGTIRRLEEEQAALKAQIADLRSQVGTLQGSQSGGGALSDLREQLERERLLSGLVAVRGQGVVAVLNDSDARQVPEGEDPANYIIHEYDLRDVLNALWAAGAEAISLNGERIVGNTSLYCVGTTILCNATRLSPPYTVRAIGDPEALATALLSSRQMAKFNARARQYSLPFTVEKQGEIELPAYNGSFSFKHATVEK